MPFANLSDDREQQYFADGITDDLTNDLSRIAGMFVISRNTAFTYWDKPIDPRQIGRELGVRYVLEGSVQRWSKQVRVNVQLIEAETDAHIWAERFDHDTSDLGPCKARSRTGSRSRSTPRLPVRRPPGRASTPTRWSTFSGPVLHLSKPSSPENYAQAIPLYERALELDPGSVAAKSWLAIALVSRMFDAMADSPAADVARAEDLARQAVAAAPRSPLAHFAKGMVLRAQGRDAEAIPEYEAVIAFNPNWVYAITSLS